MNTQFLQINYDINDKVTYIAFNCSKCGTQNEISLDGLVSIKISKISWALLALI